MGPDGNLFADAEPPETGERFEVLARMGATRIERIVSSTVPTPGTYVQSQDEWVALIRGTAQIEVAGEIIDLTPGDHLYLAARLPHRVVSTSPGALWLAVHVHAPEDVD